MTPDRPGTAPPGGRRFQWIVTAIMLSGILVTVILFWLVRQSELASFRLRLESDISLRTDTIVNKIDDSQLMVNALRNFLAASDQVTPDDFEVFAVPLLQERSEIRAVSWNPRISRNQRGEFERHETSRLSGRFFISERDSAGNQIPAGQRDHYYPIQYIEPMSGNRKAIGFDVGSNPVRLAALERARDTGRLTATERIQLVQDGNSGFSVLVFNPLYAKRQPVATVDERRAAILGVTVVVINMERLLVATLGKTAPIGLPFDLLDLSAPQERQLLHHWSARLTGSGSWLSYLLPEAPVITRTFTFCGREWGLRYTPGQEYMLRNYPLAYWLLLPAGVLLSLLTGLFLRNLLTQQQVLEKRVLERTAALGSSESSLRELNAHLEERVADRTRQLEAAVAALSLSKERAEAANRAKNIFLANMSHEIRTPLNAVLGFSQIVMRDPALSPENRHNLQIVKRSGEQLLALISDVIDVAKIEAGRMSLEKNILDLPDLLTGLAEQFAPRAAARSLQLIHETSGIEVHTVYGDEEKIRHIISSLLDNALKFTREGGVSLRSRTCSREGLDWFEVDVEDSGPGIAAEDRERIFNAFEQADIDRMNPGGTGLGLTICREYARLMGGDLTVTSDHGHGSCFHLSIPITRAQEESAARASERSLHSLRLKPGQPPCRILVVDDRDTNREILVQMLAPLGFTMIEAVNGQAGLEAFITHKPHLVLMDVVMPVMDGREATRRIRALPGGKNVPVIAVSASVFEDQLHEVMEAGATGFLRKPLREEELLEKVVSLLPFEFESAGAGGEGEEPVRAVESPGELDQELSLLPRELRSQLATAARGLDKTGLQELMAPFATITPAVAQRLRTLAETYRFDLIEDIVRFTGDGEGDHHE